MGLTKHVQAYSMSYYTLFNEKTIKKLSCCTYIQNPQKTPFFTLVPLQLSPCPKLCTIMYVVCMPQTDLDGVDGVFDQFIKCAILKIPKKSHRWRV